MTSLRTASLFCLVLGSTGSLSAEIGGQFQINSSSAGHQQRPSVAATGSGDFVVVWDSFGADGEDTSSYGIRGQRYDAAGAPIGGELEINSYTPGIQWRASVAAGGGGFVVAWTSYGSAGSDVDGTSIQLQRYYASGAKLGGELQVNSYTTSYQAREAVAVDASGHFVVA